VTDIIERAEAALAKMWDARADTERAALVPDLLADLKSTRAQLDRLRSKLTLEWRTVGFLPADKDMAQAQADATDGSCNAGSYPNGGTGTTMPELRARLADALFNRLADYGIVDHDAASALVDTLLSLPGIAIVELPKPDDTASGRNGEYAAWWGRYPDNNPQQPSRWRGHDVCAQEGFVFEGTRQQKPTLARALAAALLAAANAAEQAASNG
jgi:hypothetical protein